jgi:AcrR family transcriptional regulator
MSLRERTRRAVQREIGEAALALFVERGFDKTTIDDVAAAVGMSQRSVFRYFRTKEEILVGKFDLVVDEILTTLRGRPLDEPVWASLRRVFDVLEDQDQAQSGGTASVLRVVLETPTLLAAYLQKLQQIQETVVVALRERATYADDDPTPRALTAAAFGCLVAGQHAWLASGARGSLGDAIDRAMATLRPRD